MRLHGAASRSPRWQAHRHHRRGGFALLLADRLRRRRGHRGITGGITARAVILDRLASLRDSDTISSRSGLSAVVTGRSTQTVAPIIGTIDCLGGDEIGRIGARGHRDPEKIPPARSPINTRCARSFQADGRALAQRGQCSSTSKQMA